MKAKVYSTDSCPWCEMVKDFLKSHNVEVEVVDVGKDQQAAQEMVRKSHQFGVPVVEINEEVIVGFDKERLSKILGLNE